MNRLRFRILFSLCVATGAFLLCTLPWLVGVARAAADPVAAVTSSLDWVSVVGVILGGFGALLGGLSTILHAIAPRTKTPLDDRAAVGVDKLHDKVDGLTHGLAEVAGIVKALQPTAASKTPQSGRVLGSVLLGLSFVGLMVIAIAACTRAQLGAAATTTATTAEHAVINCTGQAIGQTPGLDLDTLAAVARTASTERARCTVNGSLDWHCVEQDALAEGKVLGGCTIVQLIASAVTGAGSARVASAAAVALQPDPGHAALEDFRARAAPGATFHATSGDY